jgi:threonine synthase
MMKYVSTRRLDEDEGSAAVSFEEALMSGYAPDRGLYVPQSLPSGFTPLELQRYAGLSSFKELSFEILRLFIDVAEIPDDDLLQICHRCFDPDNGWTDPNNIVPVIKFPQTSSSSTATCATAVPFYVAELFHGPTHCFKDFGLQIVVQLLGYFCHKREQQVTLLVATSGDTGPAAATAVANMNSPFMNIIVHYPQGQISDFQRKQMTTLSASSPRQVKVVAFEGGGDDMDVPIKNILMGVYLADEGEGEGEGEEDGNHEANSKLLRESKQCGVNSYNIGRPIMQMVHWVSQPILLPHNIVSITVNINHPADQTMSSF